MRFIEYITLYLIEDILLMRTPEILDNLYNLYNLYNSYMFSMY